MLALAAALGLASSRREVKFPPLRTTFLAFLYSQGTFESKMAQICPKTRRMSLTGE